ncbi:MAG: hypothetical protein ACSLE3_12605, partial [Microbacteriaceae bacterium]
MHRLAPWATMVAPPPPMPEDAGCITASAKAAAIAASTAEPPWARISIPASEASGRPELTPYAPSADRSWVGSSVGSSFEVAPAEFAVLCPGAVVSGSVLAEQAVRTAS